MYQNQECRKENFTPIKRKSGFSTYSALHFIAFLFAMYLSFKCNGKFVFTSFLAAFCCPWIYIIYVLATKKDLCMNINPQY